MDWIRIPFTGWHLIRFRTFGHLVSVHRKRNAMHGVHCASALVTRPKGVNRSPLLNRVDASGKEEGEEACEETNEEVEEHRKQLRHIDKREVKPRHLTGPRSVFWRSLFSYHPSNLHFSPFG